MACAIPSLRSGGLMLTYRCTNACAHCIYRCSPKREDAWITPDMLDRTLDALARERALGDLHLAGGEPTLNMDLLCETIRLCRERRITVSYVETNGWWCTTRERAEAWFRRMFEAGLRCVLISVSPFHNAFIPLRNTRQCIDAARTVFGSGGTFPYMAHLEDMIGALPDRSPHSLAEFCAAHQLDPKSSDLPDLYSLIPSGRAVEALVDCYPRRSADAFRGQACAAELMRTTHFHLDRHGNLFTGSCPGIVSGTVDHLHPELDAEHFPVSTYLLEQGPWELMDRACREQGYHPLETGYVGKCHLCLHVRTYLFRKGVYPELRPADFYAAD